MSFSPAGEANCAPKIHWLNLRGYFVEGKAGRGEDVREKERMLRSGRAGRTSREIHVWSVVTVLDGATSVCESVR